MKPVKEDSSCTFTARFWGADGAPFTPFSAQYRLKDVTNGRVLRDWTSLTITGSSVEIVIPADLNDIHNDRNSYEDHALAVKAEPGLAGQFVDEVIYKVKNSKAFKS